MFIKITQLKTKSGIKKHAKIVQSYWDKENNTSRQKIIMNLGPVNSNNDLIKYKEILSSIKRGEGEFLKKSELIVMESKEFGITYTTNQLLEKYKIDEILQKALSNNKAKFDIYGIIKALIINRLVRPSSELSAFDWICEDYSEDLDIYGHQIYRALDYLIPKKDIIEKQIFENLKEMLKLNMEFAHYDLTSTYFEGNKCSIAFYGYSRDHRKDRKQVVIGLVMIDGIPIHHEVYQGNTVDKTTLEGMIKNVKEKFGLKEIAIVADRGIITEDNLDLLENQVYQYILGVQRRNNKIPEEHLIKEIESEDKHFAKEVHKAIIKKEGREFTRRYILCLDNQTKKERLENLKEIKKDKEEKLDELLRKYKASQISKKGKKMTKESLINQAFKLLGKNKRLFHVELAEDGFKYTFNEKNYEYEEKIAGKFLLITNTDKSPEKIMKTYKELQTVENAFDESKNFLYVRPLFHWREHRVRAHIFICYLSFLVESIIERFSSESARETLSKLKRICITKVKIGNIIEKRLTRDTLFNSKEIFDEMKIKSPSMIILETKN